MLDRVIEVSHRRNLKLNKIEKIKSKKSIDEAILDLKRYAKEGYDSIDSDDKSLFFKYFGIFDKTKPLGKNSFMLRIRVPGGELNYKMAEKIGYIAQKYGKNYIDITTRMQIQLRYLQIEDIPTILEELESVGVTTYQTGIDNLRNIVTDPLDGVGYDNVIEVMPLLIKMQDIFLKKSEWIGTLPRKFNTAISGSYTNRCNLFSHDCSFVLAQKDGVFGFNLYLGGRVGAASKCANLFVKKDEVEACFKALIEIFREYGFRDSRNKNRLQFFIEEIGVESLVETIKIRSGLAFQSRGEVCVELEHHDTDFGRVELKDGKIALHMVVRAGIFDGNSMLKVAKIAKDHEAFIRLSVDQNLYIIGVDKDRVDTLLKDEIFQQYRNIDTIFFNDLISCAGSTDCQYGVISGKKDAIELSKYLSQVVDIKRGKVRIYWSACIKGCGIHELGDIGILGSKAKVDGKSVEGVDIFIGGKLLGSRVLAKRVLKSIVLDEAKYYIKELLLEYIRLKRDGESFGKFYDRVLLSYPSDAIAFVMSFNYLSRGGFKIGFCENSLAKSEFDITKVDDMNFVNTILERGELIKL